jgi:hypothetical protein
MRLIASSPLLWEKWSNRSSKGLCAVSGLHGAVQFASIEEHRPWSVNAPNLIMKHGPSFMRKRGPWHCPSGRRRRCDALTNVRGVTASENYADRSNSPLTSLADSWRRSVSGPLPPTKSTISAQTGHQDGNQWAVLIRSVGIRRMGIGENHYSKIRLRPPSFFVSA